MCQPDSVYLVMQLCPLPRSGKQAVSEGTQPGKLSWRRQAQRQCFGPLGVPCLQTTMLWLALVTQDPPEILILEDTEKRGPTPGVMKTEFLATTPYVTLAPSPSVLRPHPIYGA